MKKAINNVKEVFEGDVKIIKILQGSHHKVRIDAKTRFYESDKENFFSKWVTEKYANQLALENFGKKVNEFSVYQY